jgi:hypothetical protein
MPKNEKIRYYQSSIGKPYATLGRYIATYIGRFDGKRRFGSTTIKKFGKKKLSKLREITHGMPGEFKRGLEKELLYATKLSKIK